MSRNDNETRSSNLANSQENSNTQNTSGFQERDRTDEDDRNIDIPNKCLRFIEQFTEGHLNKQEALECIANALPRGDANQTYSTFALASYQNMLTNLERIRERRGGTLSIFAG